MTLTDLVPWRRPTSLFSMSEWSPIVSMQREMNRMFEDLWGTTRPRIARTVTPDMAMSFFPDIDITDADKYLDLTAEVPGMTDKDIKINLSDNGETMTIEGEKRLEKEVKSEDLYCSERRYGRFRRVLDLPSAIDSASVEATCKNGVLKVHMKKLPDSQQHVRQIPIKSA